MKELIPSQIFLLNTQSDNKWNKEIMTGPDDFPDMPLSEKMKRWQKLRPDNIGRWGCWVTTWTNIINDKKKNDGDSERFNPNSMNEYFRKNKLYWIFSYNSECEIGSESFAYRPGIEKLFNCRFVDKVSSKRIDKNWKNRYWMARVPFSPEKGIFSGHYNMVLDNKNNTIYHFDSDSGVIRTDWGNSDNYWLIEVIFNK